MSCIVLLCTYYLTDQFEKDMCQTLNIHSNSNNKSILDQQRQTVFIYNVGVVVCTSYIKIMSTKYNAEGLVCLGNGPICRVMSTGHRLHHRWPTTIYSNMRCIEKCHLITITYFYVYCDMQEQGGLTW